MELINRVSTLQMQLEERRLEGVDAISKVRYGIFIRVKSV